MCICGEHKNDYLHAHMDYPGQEKITRNVAESMAAAHSQKMTCDGKNKINGNCSSFSKFSCTQAGKPGAKAEKNKVGI